MLWRSAEGYIRHWFALLGAMLVAGLWVPLYGEQAGNGRLYGKTIFLPDKLGWGGALIGMLAILSAFYFFITWLELKKK
ncbi:MAG: hypothetical protein C4560_04920 [Nitrospiraceae bacterium]|nr:MAG: hypothetical protein C4560_04920 [Nitrospiraceae bacterium]